MAAVSMCSVMSAKRAQLLYRTVWTGGGSNVLGAAICVTRDGAMKNFLLVHQQPRYGCVHWTSHLMCKFPFWRHPAKTAAADCLSGTQVGQMRVTAAISLPWASAHTNVTGKLQNMCRQGGH